ncbi:hypothetical protein DWV87_00735 [Ruminococcus sp. AF13-28]|nr:hypothetical protein DWV90_00715 [Ruminococcus sp. AF13-37]RGW24892.1 hypothetical protein DWV87_00735 [Ruminococcus sp. AF13-28]
MEYMQLSMDDYIQSKNEIKQELGGIVKSFVRIGWQLTRIDKSGAYKHDGYNTIAEFAKAEYGMNPSGVSRFMNVYERYSLPGDTPELQEQYKDFKFAQLTEMLQLPEEDRQIFHAEDKREDIRELKDFNKENENNPMNLLDWKSAQNTEDKLKATIQEFFHEKQGVLNTLYSSETYQAGNIKGMSQIINPGDSMSYRKGTVFLMFHQEDITVKIFNGEMKNITWEQFFAYTQEIFAEAAAGNRTYENYFGIPEEAPAEPEKEEISPTTEQSVRPEPKIAPAQPEPTKEPVEKVDNSVDKCQKTAVEEKEELRTESTVLKPDFQTSEPKPKNTGKSQEIPLSEPEPQIPGQDNIQNHPEYMPEPVTEQDVRPESEIAPAQSEQPVESPITRKTYMDSLTAYGTADYLAKAMRSFANKTYNMLLDPAFWERWLNEKVDHNGRPWEN